MEFFKENFPRNTVERSLKIHKTTVNLPPIFVAVFIYNVMYYQMSVRGAVTRSKSQLFFWQYIVFFDEILESSQQYSAEKFP